MKTRFNPGSLTPAKAVALQRRLAGKVRLESYGKLPRLVAGADVSCERFGTTLWGGIVVLDRKSWDVVEQQVACTTAQFPYIPGLLSFREIPVLLEAAALLQVEPDVILVDGQGLAHPRRLGLACHLGLLLDQPTIGCAKSRLVGSTRRPLRAGRGSRQTLYDRGEKIGSLLRTRDNVKPLWISPGHRTDFAAAIRVALLCTAGFRLPEHR